jgi:hypothetical protein
MEFIRISNSNKYAYSRVGFQEKEFHAIFRHNFFFLIFPFVSKICRGKNRVIRTYPTTDFTGVTCVLCLYWKLVKITYFCTYLCTQNRTDFVSRGTLWIWKQQCKHNVKQYKRTKTSTRYEIRSSAPEQLESLVLHNIKQCKRTKYGKDITTDVRLRAPEQLESLVPL